MFKVSVSVENGSHFVGFVKCIKYLFDTKNPYADPLSMEIQIHLKLIQYAKDIFLPAEPYIKRK
jgi:hypothetical protein